MPTIRLLSRSALWIALLSIGIPARAEEPPTNLIPVVGHASYSAAPDEVSISLTLRAEGSDPKSAHTQLHAILEKVTAVAVANDIAGDRLQIGRVGTAKTQGKKDEAIAAMREVALTLVDVTRFDLLDAGLVGIDGATITAIRFGLKDRQSIVAKLTTAAAEDARAQAGAIALGAGGTILRLHHASLGATGTDGSDAQRMALRAGSASTSYGSLLSSGSYSAGVAEMSVMPPLQVTIGIMVEAAYLVGGPGGN